MGRGRGFTLIELVFVTLILGVLTGMAAPVFRRSYRRLGMEAASWNLTSSLAYARERAVMDRAPVRVLFDDAAGTWRLATYEAGQFVDRRDRWARPRRLASGLSFKFPPPFVTFYPDGTADETSVDITSAGEKVLRLRVDALLGRATAEETDNEG